MICVNKTKRERKGEERNESVCERLSVWKDVWIKVDR